MGKIKVGLVSHLFEDYNLGCVALSIANLKLMDDVFKKMNLKVHYVVLITESFSEAPLKDYTNNTYEYRYYPRFRQTITNPKKLFKTTVFDDCNMIVNLCGGDGYTDIYGFVRLLAESQVAYAAAKKGVGFIFAPQTIGPFNMLLSKMVAKLTLKNAKKVFVRDSSSMDCCSQLGIAQHTHQVIDVAFALPFEKKEFNTDKPRIGLNISGLLYNGGYNRNNYFGLSFNYKAFTNELVQRLISMKNIELHLIPHVITETNEIDDDYRVCKAIVEKYPSAILAPKFTSPIDAKNYISGMNLFAGARMHSTIGAFSSNVPVIPIAYSRKFNGLYNTLEYPYYIDAKSSLTKEQALDKFFEYMENIGHMQKALLRGKEIYLAGLEQYKEFFKMCISEEYR